MATKRRTAEHTRTGFIVFASWDPPYYCSVLLGEGNGTPTEGYGGWSVVDRDRRRGLTEYTGSKPLEIVIPILFDNFLAGETIEPAIKQLEKMAGLGHNDEDGPEPPLITFNSGGVIPYDAHDSVAKDWVITSLEWGECLRNNAGNRIRQKATVTVTQYINDDVLSRMSPSKKRKKTKKKNSTKRATRKQGARNKIYIVKRNGESLKTIAKSELGDSNRWHEIAKLNNMRDPRATRKNQRLRLP